MVKKIRWSYAFVDGVRKHIDEVCSGTHGICLLCRHRLIAKKGEINAPHWAHENGGACDVWYQPKGDWHRYWQNLFPREWQEVVVEREKDKHIADIKTSREEVIEVQWSPISCGEIEEREKFYGKMIWIVGASESSNNKRLKRFLEQNAGEGKGEFEICEVDDLFFEKLKWLYCSRPVFVDIDGTEESPVSEGDLYYIIPQKSDQDDRHVAKVSRKKLVKAFCEGTARELFQRIKDARDLYVRNKIAHRNEQLVQMRADEITRREELYRQNREKAEPYIPFSDTVKNAIGFVTRAFHHPPRCALTIGWMAAFMIIEGDLKQLTIDAVEISIAPYGRVALHLAQNYSREEYEQDCLRARQRGISGNFESYDVLVEECRDKIVACVDYLVKHTDKGLLLTFASPYRFLKPGAKAWTWGRSQRTFWTLPEKTQEYLGNVDIVSRNQIGL